MPGVEELRKCRRRWASSRRIIVVGAGADDGAIIGDDVLVAENPVPDIWEDEGIGVGDGIEEHRLRITRNHEIIFPQRTFEFRGFHGGGASEGTRVIHTRGTQVIGAK